MVSATSVGTAPNAIGFHGSPLVPVIGGLVDRWPRTFHLCPIHGEEWCRDRWPILERGKPARHHCSGCREVPVSGVEDGAPAPWTE
jgi:hypothetical protein